MAPKSKKDKNNYTEFKSAFLCSTLQPVRKRRVFDKRRRWRRRTPKQGPLLRSIVVADNILDPGINCPGRRKSESTDSQFDALFDFVGGDSAGQGDRGEKAGDRSQIFSISRRIVVLFNEKSGKYGPIPTAFAVDSFCRAGY